VAKSIGPDAVLWDMDGTLVDTEPYWIAAEFEVASRYGGTWDHDRAKLLVGADLLDAGRSMRELAGIDVTPEQIVDELLDSVVESIRQEIPWRPGARELLAALNDADIPCALVTMSWRRFAEPVVDALPRNSFRVIVTGDEVARGKPHPEPYLEAARRLGVAPRRCLAIEDSPTGVASATAAGCVVVAVPNVVAVPPGPGHTLLESLTELDLDGMRAYFAPAWRRRRLGLAVATGAVLALVAAGVTSTATGDESSDGPVAAVPLDGWAPGWAWERDGADWAKAVGRVREFSPFWLQVVDVDRLEPMPGTQADLAEALIARARSAGALIVPSIVDGLPAGGMAAVVGDQARRARHVATIVQWARDGDWDGVDIDYEQFAFADGRDTWADTSPDWIVFVTELANALRAEGRTLTVTVPPVYAPGRSDEAGYWVYDHAALAEVADRVRIMAYDYSTATPGPIAPLGWVQQVVEGAVEVTGRPDKVVLGIPVYGYNWPTGANGTCPPTAQGRVGVTARSIDDLIERRGLQPVFDTTTGEWAAVYDVEVDDGTTRCVQARRVHWVDGEGAAERARLAQQAGLGGVSLWAMGYEDDGVWAALDPVLVTP